MGDHIAEHDRHENSQLYAKELKDAADCLKRYDEDDYRKEEHEIHYQKWGEHIMDFVDTEVEGYSELKMSAENANTPEEIEQELDEWRAINARGEEDKQADKIKAFNLIRDRLEHWWC